MRPIAASSRCPQLTLRRGIEYHGGSHLAARDRWASQTMCRPDLQVGRPPIPQ